MTHPFRSPFAFALSLLLCGTACQKEAAPVAPGAPSPAAAAPATPPAPQPTPAPDLLIAELYEQQAKDQGPFFQAERRDRVDHYFETSLADLIWNDVAQSKDEPGSIDFDPLYDAQDTEIRNFKIQPAVVDGQTASVPVTFDNFGKKTEIVYSLQQEHGSWKISDIRWDQDRSLRALLSAPPG